MTDFEKIIISLLGEHFKKEDFNKDYGFIDTFTVDRDKPTGCNEFFIAIDDRIRNKNSIDIARRYNNSPNLKRKYIKTINGIPYYVYSYWIGPILNKLYKDGIYLSTDDDSFNGAVGDQIRYIFKDKCKYERS